MTDTRELPCHECGAPLTFQPGAGMMVCQFCGTENEIEGAAQALSPWGAKTGAGPEIKELDYQAALRGALDATEIEETATLKCPGCAAEVSLDASTLADECPFCATPLSRDAEQAHKHPKPGGVLPFALNDRDARQKMAD
ncbi:MAG: TFIIB-type zinc finger domain-containing protein, partial [Pseudomonadota bacterium]